MTDVNLRGIGMTSQRTRNRLVARLAERGITSAEVLEAIASVPRHIFVDEALEHRAYEDNALPIGHGQTISQPYIVALMTQTLLEAAPRRVLEVGSGSAYQTAVLAELVERVYAVERIEPLLARGVERLRTLGYRNVRTRHADGAIGWAEQGPFDGILVAAAARFVPDALVQQLDVGGRLVIPVGDGDVQELVVVDRSADGVEQRRLQQVRFVPMLKGTQR